MVIEFSFCRMVYASVASLRARQMELSRLTFWPSSELRLLKDQQPYSMAAMQSVVSLTAFRPILFSKKDCRDTSQLLVVIIIGKLGAAEVSNTESVIF